MQVIEKYADALTKKIAPAVHLPIDLEPWTIYGIALIVLMYTMPMGIAGGLAALWRRLKRSQRRAVGRRNDRVFSWQPRRKST